MSDIIDKISVALREGNARRSTRAEAIAGLRKLWDEGLSSGSSDDLDIPAIKRQGRQSLQRLRK